ncbi:hypothetical protein RJ640_016261 [Escallonia rubra]|uniref:GAG-pre-integrase domain-containing protein n=1 Tax=Escallonia rubra TaxID=112253 RepID=A0AA88QL12_9ASTE|nr:hypothetical protein RJ640_016261 [Escallonia rubra]
MHPPQDGFQLHPLEMHRLEGLRRRFPIERRHAGQHYVQDHPSTPHVDLLVVLPAGQHLRRDVVRRPDDPAHRPPLVPPEPLGGSEIGELESVPGVKEDVVGLDVAVRHAQPVAVTDRAHQRAQDPRRLGLGQGALGDAVVQIGRVAEVGDEEEGVVVLVYVEEVDDVGMAGEEVEELGLDVEASPVGGVGEEALVDGLAGEGGGGVGGEAAVDDAEPAAADLFAQLALGIKMKGHKEKKSTTGPTSKELITTPTIYLLIQANQDVKCLSAISETSWLWHRRLGHMHMEHLKDISSKELVRGLLKIKFEKDKVLGTPFDGYSSTYAFLFLNALVGYNDYPWMDT